MMVSGYPLLPTRACCAPARFSSGSCPGFSFGDFGITTTPTRYFACGFARQTHPPSSHFDQERPKLDEALVLFGCPLPRTLGLLGFVPVSGPNHRVLSSGGGLAIHHPCRRERLFARQGRAQPRLSTPPVQITGPGVAGRPNVEDLDANVIGWGAGGKWCSVDALQDDGVPLAPPRESAARPTVLPPCFQSSG